MKRLTAGSTNRTRAGLAKSWVRMLLLLLVLLGLTQRRGYGVLSSEHDCRGCSSSRSLFRFKGAASKSATSRKTTAQNRRRISGL